MVSASTLSGNSAAQFGGGILQIANSGSATVDIGDTILKAGASGPNIMIFSGTFTSHGYNLSSDDGSGLLTATGDQNNTTRCSARCRTTAGRPSPTRYS